MKDFHAWLSDLTADLRNEGAADQEKKTGVVSREQMMVDADRVAWHESPEGEYPVQLSQAGMLVRHKNRLIEQGLMPVVNRCEVFTDELMPDHRKQSVGYRLNESKLSERIHHLLNAIWDIEEHFDERIGAGQMPTDKELCDLIKQNVELHILKRKG